MTSADPADLGVRGRVRAAIKGELAESAVRAFEKNGFDATTIDHIVDQVGISRRTFFRYFESKEDAVLQPLEDLGRSVAAALAARPAKESVRLSLRRALDVLVEHYAANEAQWSTVMKLVLSTPSLRARHLVKQDEWLAEMGPVLARRMGADATDLRPRLYCATFLGASDAGLRAWFSGQAAGSLGDAIDEAIRSLDDLFE